MSDWVKDIRELHAKFGVREVVSKMPPDRLAEYLLFRISMMQEELTETLDARSANDSHGLIDGVIDLCVFAIGTLDVFGVDATEAWNRVHAANMSKKPGIKPERPNPYGFPDMIKPVGWREPRHDDLVSNSLALALEN